MHGSPGGLILVHTLSKRTKMQFKWEIPKKIQHQYLQKHLKESWFAKLSQNFLEFLKISSYYSEHVSVTKIKSIFSDLLFCRGNWRNRFRWILSSIILQLFTIKNWEWHQADFFWEFSIQSDKTLRWLAPPNFARKFKYRRYRTIAWICRIPRK